MDEWRQERGEAPQGGDEMTGGTAGASRIGDDTAGATRADGGGTSGGGGTAGGGGGSTGGMAGTPDDIGAGDSISEAGTGGAAQPDADITES